MCQIIEEIVNETAAQATHECSVATAIKLLARKKLTNAEIAEATGLSLDEVQALAAKAFA